MATCRTFLPPEYCFNIPTSSFSQESSWTVTECYTRSALNLKTKLSLLTDITGPTHQRTTSAVVMLTMQNRNPESEYHAQATVRLYDEKAGRLLKEKTEERKVEGGRSYVKFVVDVGLQEDIEATNSKKLQLQVKVRVDERQTLKTYWEKVMLHRSGKAANQTPDNTNSRTIEHYREKHLHSIHNITW